MGRQCGGFMWLKGEVALWVMHACFCFFLNSAGHWIVFFSIKGEPFFHYVMVFLEIFCIKFLPLSRNKGFFFLFFSKIAAYWAFSCETCSSSAKNNIILSLQQYVQLKQDKIFGIKM